jgi:glycosyltransferase involved in cell wall biosynthesis
MTSCLLHVFREAVRENVDLYHFHDLELIPVGLFLRALGKRVIYDIHEDYPRRGIFCKQLIPGLERPTLGWLLEKMENLACGHFSALIVATPTIASRFNGQNTTTIMVQNYPSLAEFECIATPWRERSNTVAYVGQMSKARGTRQIVQAMELLPEGLNATLKLVGSFFPLSFGEELARMPAWKRVEAMGFLDHKRVVQVLTTVRAGLVTFHPEPNHTRAQPTKLFEYMATGIPVIASDFPLWREIIDGARCGLLVDPRNPKAIAEAIDYLLTHSEEAEAMGARGRKAVESRYNWGTEERELLQLYATLQEGA